MSVWLERRSQRRSVGTSVGSSRSSENASRGFNSTRDDSEFQRDRARIIHSASFRSLQSKTQVLGLGESDFYRTRLTHSLEVAQIGSGICEWLRDQPQNRQNSGLIPSFSLIEAICLAHDIGHSPFGHGGEVAMNSMMRDEGGFEANGQTLRIIARLGEYSPDAGLDLTRRSMLGTIKYPALYSEVCRYRPEPDSSPTAPSNTLPGNTPLNIDTWTPPKCVYDSESDVMDWLLEHFSPADQDRFREHDSSGKGHIKTLHKPFDTSIMELADDIAYGVHDLEDALALGLVDKDAWLADVAARIDTMSDNPIKQRMESFNQDLFSRAAKDRKHAISRLVGYFIRSISLIRQAEFEHDLLALQAHMDTEAFEILQLLKRFVMQHVILRPELQMLQYKGQQVILKLFQTFAANPDRLLPVEVRELHQRQGRRAIADYLCAMTDVSAGKLFHKLSSPTSGSIFDRS